jgi:hypothetical protein
LIFVEKNGITYQMKNLSVLIFMLASLFLLMNGVNAQESGPTGVKRVFTLVVDGLHQIDLLNMIKNFTQYPNIAYLAENGLNYPQAESVKPSDSSPGLIGIFTGGNPASTGIWYEQGYDRTLYPPGSNCTGPIGAVIDISEITDFDGGQSLNGGGGTDPSKLTLDPTKGCTPVYQHNLLKVNTVFNVVKDYYSSLQANATLAAYTDKGGDESIMEQIYETIFSCDDNDPNCETKECNNNNDNTHHTHNDDNDNTHHTHNDNDNNHHIHNNDNTHHKRHHRRNSNSIPPVPEPVKPTVWTAYSDKQVPYEILQGPEGNGVDNLFNPEVNCLGSNKYDFTASTWYDTLKIDAVLGWIKGQTTQFGPQNGTHTSYPYCIIPSAPVIVTGTNPTNVTTQPPVIFGTSIVSFNLVQRTTINGNPYLDAAGTPSPLVIQAMEFMDQQIGRILLALATANLLDTTLFVLVGKHGNTPLDPLMFRNKNSNAANAVYGSPHNLVTPTSLLPAGSILWSNEGDDDVIWLNQTVTNTSTAVQTFRNNIQALGLQKLYFGESIKYFGDPSSPRTPDIYLNLVLGTDYDSNPKFEDHGGIGQDSVQVGLLLSHPSIAASPKRTQYAPVRTTQVAPTILAALGIDPTLLQAVQQEGTPKLPGLPF